MTPEEVQEASREDLESYLLSRCIEVYDYESTEVLRTAAGLDAALVEREESRLPAELNLHMDRTIAEEPTP